jgi:hypothetical protein
MDTKKIQAGAIDAAIVIGGAALLDKLVGNISFIADLLAKLPADVMGASVKVFVLGATSLIAWRMYAK